MTLSIQNKQYYARGKRGIVSLAQWKGKKVLIKEHNPTSSVDTIAHEALILKKVNAFGVGPKFFAYENNALIREFIDGEEIASWVEHASAAEIRAVLSLLLEQCRAMDVALIDKTEMNHPDKHILVRKNTPVQIDFERSRISHRPKNVTQICQWLTNSGFAKLIRSKNVNFDHDALFSLAKKYKQTYDGGLVDQMISLLTDSSLKSRKNKKTVNAASTVTFAEQVYALVRQVPKGKVTTYKELAHALDSGAYRAVGQVLRCNPYAPHVPCHRVVASDGTLGGFNGAKSGPDIQRKIALLHSEGVTINDGKVVDFAKKRHSFSA